PDLYPFLLFAPAGRFGRSTVPPEYAAWYHYLYATVCRLDHSNSVSPRRRKGLGPLGARFDHRNGGGILPLLLAYCKLDEPAPVSLGLVVRSADAAGDTGFAARGAWRGANQNAVSVHLPCHDSLGRACPLGRDAVYQRQGWVTIAAAIRP